MFRRLACAALELSSSVYMQGLGRMEMDNLRDWEAKFNFKYPIVGSLVKG